MFTVPNFTIISANKRERDMFIIAIYLPNKYYKLLSINLVYNKLKL